jgi:hypothetical protein
MQVPLGVAHLCKHADDQMKCTGMILQQRSESRHL